jgi:hypothetical protein
MRAISVQIDEAFRDAYLSCECGWESDLARGVTVDKLVEIAAEHQVTHWIGEMPATLVGVAVATGIVAHDPETFARILRETVNDLIVRTDQIVADLQASADARADEVVNEALSDAEPKGATGHA